MNGSIERAVLKGENGMKAAPVIFNGLLKLFSRNTTEPTEDSEEESSDGNETYNEVRGLLAKWANVEKVNDGDKIIDLGLDPQDVILNLMMRGYITGGVVVNNARNFKVRDLLKMLD